MPEDEKDGLDNPQGDKGADASKGNSGADAPNSGDQSALEKLEADLAEAKRSKAAAHLEAKQEREARQAMRTELDSVKETQLKEQGEYKTLYETEVSKNAILASEAAKAERLEAAMIATNEQRALSLPEDLRSVVPDLPPEAKATWLDENLSKLTRAPIPNVNAGAGGSGGIPTKPDVEITQAEKDAAEIAAQYGRKVDPESMARRRVAKTK